MRPPTAVVVLTRAVVDAKTALVVVVVSVVVIVVVAVVRISFELIEATFNTLAAASPLLGKLVCFPLAYFSPF